MKFDSSIEPPQIQIEDSFFTCPIKCRACNVRCTEVNKHQIDKRESKNHKCNTPCKFNKDYKNIIYLCLACERNGLRSVATQQIGGDQDGSLYKIVNYTLSA